MTVEELKKLIADMIDYHWDRGRSIHRVVIGRELVEMVNANSEDGYLIEPVKFFDHPRLSATIPVTVRQDIVGVYIV